MFPFLACLIFRTILLGTCEIESLVSDLMLSLDCSVLFCALHNVQEKNITNKVLTGRYFIIFILRFHKN